MTKLSIIVPVYNVEKYIRPCFESIFKQGLDESIFEVIIVNDGSTDHSMEMIEDIISQHHNIIVINQENQGLSVARNNGIAQAKGEYIFMPDSDDLVIDNSLLPILEIALRTKVDMVVADFLTMNDEEIASFHGVYQNHITIKEKTAEQLTLEDLNPHQCYVWRTLFRRMFILDNHISFTPGITYQDVPFTHECCLKANRCIRTSRLLNIYRKRQGSATSVYNVKKGKDFCLAITKTWKLTKTNTPSNIQQKLKDNIFTSFSMMIFQTSRLKTKSERLEIIDYMKQLAPDISFTNTFKQKCYTLFYKYMPHGLIHIRYIYGKTIEETILPFYHRYLKGYEGYENHICY